MIKTTIWMAGDSTVITLTPEMLSILGAGDGDTLLVTAGDDGSLRITRHDPAVIEALAAAEIVIDENDELLRGLAGNASSGSKA